VQTFLQSADVAVRRQPGRPRRLSRVSC
jgi:hypothetical protein